MKQAEWAEKCRRLREDVEQEFADCTVDQLFPNEPKRRAIEAEYRFRQAIMERDRAERALILGVEATPFFAFIGVFLAVVGVVALALWIYDWLGRGWRGGLWALGLMILVGLLLESQNQPKNPSFWRLVALALTGVAILFSLIELLSLAVRSFAKLWM